MTIISQAVPEQSSRFSTYVVSILTTAMLAVAGFVVVVAPFSFA